MSSAGGLARHTSPPDFVGRWSRDLGHETDLVSDVVLVFEDGGTGAIETSVERIALSWRMDEEARLVLSVAGQESGPFRIEIVERDLPLGRFYVLVSSGALVPFGVREFTRVAP